MTYPRFLLSLTFASALFAQTPRILFSDLDSGPKTGGENNLGVYVTIYGSNFGSVRGNSIVIIGGGAAANYPVWTDSKVTFQVGGAAASGEIRIQTGGGVSNGVPFTVRTGGIFFVSTSGSDANTGATGAPWRTVQWAVDHVAAGDTIYLTNGVVETRLGTSDGSVSISRNFGAAGAPKALIGYPGAVATIGSTGSAPCTTTGCFEGIKTIYASDYWTVAGLRLVGNDYGIVVRGANWRVIGNELTCPWGNGASACLDGTQATNVKVWGNNIHDAGYYRGPKDQSSDLYHGIYFSTDSNLLDIGWNRVENVKGCRGIQIHSSRIDNNSGFNQYGISIHDNVIRNTQCDGIVLATIDPSRGAITIFNNLIVNAGQGPITFEGGGNFACIYAAGYTNAGPQGAGVVDIYNNTMVNCGNSSVPGGSSAVAYARRTTTIDVRLRNNILYQTNGAPYIIAYDGAQGIIGSNNLFYGNGAAPSTFPNLSGSLTGDPRFANPAGDFHLVSGSPARGTGLDTGLATDIEGKARSAPHDLGAYAGIGQPGVAPPAAVPGFSLSANPSSITLSEGASAITTTVTLIPVNGFSGTAQLTCQQTPAALSCFNASVSPGQPVTLTLSFPGLRTGTYPITIFGQSGSTASVTSLTLIIQAAPSGGFGGGGTGGLGGGVTPTTPTAGVRSITVRPASGWARANYGLISLTDFRFDLRVHDIQPQSSGRGVLFQTDSPYIGGLGIRTLGQTTRIEAIGLPDDNPSAPACAVEFQETDAVIRFQRAGSQFSLRVYDRTGTTELPGSVGPCWYRSINADGVGSLALGADLGGNGRSAFSIA